jgi:hypothetical protein
MGDFYVYYTGSDLKPTFTVATTDFSTTYIKEHRKFKAAKNIAIPKDHVLLWSWKLDNVTILPLQAIKKLVPLNTVVVQK